MGIVANFLFSDYRSIDGYPAHNLNQQRLSQARGYPSLFEVTIWVFIASRVIGGISEQPIKGIVYSLGFATGVFVGSKLENYLAFGKVLIQTITSADNGLRLAEELRKSGYGVTTIEAKGKDTDRTVLMIYTNRKGKEQLIKLIHDADENAMIISNDITTLQGATFPLRAVSLSKETFKKVSFFS